MVNRRMFIIIVIASLLTNLSGNSVIHALSHKAQTDPRIQIMQPSSDAQSLGNFAEVPVDLYSGRTNINIPLFTVSYNDIQVPISISYHGGGIKTDEEANSVGLGWTLNASGVVNRIVRGMPDDLYEKGKIAGYDYLDQLNVGGFDRFHEFIKKIENKVKGNSPTGIVDNSTPEEKTLLRWMQDYGMLYDEGRFDTSPDNFIFSVQGLYGAFVNGHINQKQSNIGCKLSQTDDGFHITDVNGLTYSFRREEKQYYPYKVKESLWLADWETIGQDKFLYTSAWWLTSIKSTVGDSVDFYYKTIKKRRRSPHTYAYTQYKYIDQDGREDYDCNFITPHNSFMDTVHHQHTLLTEIYTPHSRAVFHYSDRIAQEDIACLVDSISLYASGAYRETLIERYKFTYSGISNRAKLLSITRQGRYGQTQRYNFTYYPSVALEIDEKDHWGYYARDSRGTFPYKTYLDIAPQKLYSDQVSSRHANNEHATNNMLASIMYPSGLNVKFTWEPHDFSKWSKVGEAAYKEYAYNDKNPIIYDTIFRNQYELCGKLNRENLSATIHLSPGQYFEVDLLHYFYDNNFDHLMHCVGNWQQDYMDSELPTFSIIWNNREIYSRELNSKNVQINQVKNKISELISTYGSGYYTFRLTNPRSTFISASSNPPCSLYQDEFNRPETELGKIPIKIFEVTAKKAPTSECYVGGVRIKNIEYYQGDSILLRKEYFYVDSLGKSTGVLAYPPRYASAYPILQTTFGDGGQGAADATLNNKPNGLFLRSNGLPYVLNSGGHIEYEQVTEVMKSKDNIPINKTVYYYLTSNTSGYSDVDDTDYGTLMPTDMLQLTSKKHWRGDLWKKVEYTDEYRTTQYEYQVIELPDTEYFTGALFPIADFQHYSLNTADSIGSINAYKNFGIVSYRVIPYNKRLLSTHITGEKTRKSDVYTYDTNSYSSTLNADLPITHTYTASDAVPLIDSIVYKNNTSKISKCITKKDGYIVAGDSLEYDSLYRITKKYLARINPNGLNNVQWDMVESYKYDTTINKLIEVKNIETNITTTYLWSYRGQYPIAKIINATVDDVKAKIGTNHIRGLRDTYTPEMYMVNNLRNLLPNASVSTMTYEPLVGMTSYTDEKGYTLYYRYDDFGQLQDVYEMKQDSIHILKHFDYQITNQ